MFYFYFSAPLNLCILLTNRFAIAGLRALYGTLSNAVKDLIYLEKVCHASSFPLATLFDVFVCLFRPSV